MDIQMPIMDGLEAAARIRSSNGGRIRSTIPIIALTAYAMSGDEEKFLASGINAYISKPVDIWELSDTLRMALLEEAC